METPNDNTPTLNVTAELQKLEATPKDMHRVYKSTQPTSFIFPNGKYAHFIGNRYLTKNPKEIAILDEEISLGNPHIFVDPEEKEADKNLENPVEYQKRKIIKEYLETLAKAMNPANDAGTSISSHLNPASSMDVQAAAAGGSGSGVSQRIGELLKSLNQK